MQPSEIDDPAQSLTVLLISTTKAVQEEYKQKVLSGWCHCDLYCWQTLNG